MTSVFFSDENIWVKVVHFFRKILTDEKTGDKTNKTHQVRSWKGHMEDVCKFHGLNRKNGVNIRRGIHLGFLACTSLYAVPR